MVQRTPVLLSLIVLLGCLSCNPETLKIHIPPKGIDSVNQEDLRRAYWALERGADPIKWWSSRANQFNLRSSSSGCDESEVDGDNRGIVHAQLTPMQLTVIASMAKALDGIETKHSWQFCIGEIESHDVNGKVIFLSENWGESPPFIDVNFTQLVQEIREGIRGYKLLE